MRLHSVMKYERRHDHRQDIFRSFNGFSVPFLYYKSSQSSSKRILLNSIYRTVRSCIVITSRKIIIINKMYLCKRGLLSYIRNGQSVMGAASQCQKHTLPDLPYDYNALEPIICAEIMKIHHSKHHAAYVNNLNVAEEKLKEAQAKNDVSNIIALCPAMKFNGGGHLNHSIFWKNLSPCGGSPDSDLCEAINRDFGSMDNMKAQLSALSVGVQGSGWGWLGYNKQKKGLQLAACANQDPLEATTGLIPLFGIDVWEHAYYLQYKNVRPDYVKAIFDIANWKDVSERFAKARC